MLTNASSFRPTVVALAPKCLPRQPTTASYFTKKRVSRNEHLLESPNAFFVRSIDEQNDLLRPSILRDITRSLEHLDWLEEEANEDMGEEYQRRGVDTLEDTRDGGPNDCL
jgi:hypothetical protein